MNLRHLILTTAIILSACATSPTGRSQLMLLPDSQMDTLGIQSFEQMKAETPIERDPQVNTYVKCVASSVAREASGQIDVGSWEIVVFKDKTANAFALPGGKIGVHTGILPVAKTPAQLAAVLGHEIGHVIARHGNERMSASLATQIGLMGAGILAKDSPHRDLALALMGVGAQGLILLPHSRTQESEADLIGLKLMAQAGFDPQESVLLWKNMASAGGGQPPEFLSTHPSHENRISNLSAHMPEALGIYQQARNVGKSPVCQVPVGKF